MIARWRPERGGEAGGLMVRLRGERWVDPSLEDSIRPNGAQLLEYVEDNKAQLPRNDVEP